MHLGLKRSKTTHKNDYKGCVTAHYLNISVFNFVFSEFSQENIKSRIQISARKDKKNENTLE